MTMISTRTLLSVLILSLLTSLTVACGDSEDDGETSSNTTASNTTASNTTASNTTASNTTASNTTSEVTEQTLTFAVKVGAEDFTCGVTYTGLGSTGDGELTIVDMRLYVYGVTLIADDGTTESLEMEDTGVWQTSGVALLDFEDGCGDAGTTEVNATITGMAPNKNYTGVEFSVGIPPELNSMETVLENRGSPLNLSSMYWSWQSGYKFIRIDTMNNFRVHLGSGGCGEDFNCTAPNQPTIRIEGMDLSSQAITLDVAALVANTDVTQNTEETAPGCMAGPEDPECFGVFDALGLEYEGEASTGQKAFSAQ